MMEINVDVLITAGIGLITTFIGSWTSWLFARKKYNAEVDSNLISNLQKSLDFYEKLVNDNNIRLEELLQRNKELEDRDAKLEEEVRQLRIQMMNLMGQLCTNFACSARTRNINLYGNNITEEV